MDINEKINRITEKSILNENGSERERELYEIRRRIYLFENGVNGSNYVRRNSCRKEGVGYLGGCTEKEMMKVKGNNINNLLGNDYSYGNMNEIKICSCKCNGNCHKTCKYKCHHGMCFNNKDKEFKYDNELHLQNNSNDYNYNSNKNIAITSDVSMNYCNTVPVGNYNANKYISYGEFSSYTNSRKNFSSYSVKQKDNLLYSDTNHIKKEFNYDSLYFSKYSFEIVCNQKSHMQNELQQKENTISELLNTILYLEKELEEQKNKNEEMQFEHNKIISMLNFTNTHLKEENMRLKENNNKLYNLYTNNCKDKLSKEELNVDQKEIEINDEKEYFNVDNVNDDIINYDIIEGNNITETNMNNNNYYVTEEIEENQNEIHHSQPNLNNEGKTNLNENIYEIKNKQTTSEQVELISQNQNDISNNLLLSLSLSEKEDNDLETRSQLINSQRNSNLIFTIYNKNQIISFNKHTKSFNIIDFIDDSNFAETFHINGSLFLSLPDILYIITGDSYNILFKFILSKKLMIKVNTLNNNHYYGELLYIENTKSLICLSGAYNKTVESFSLLNQKQWQTLNNEMNTERSSASYYIFNNEIIFAFFGFNCIENKYLNDIEYCNITNIDDCFWNKIECINNPNNINLNLKGHFVFGIGESSENEEGLVIIGGYDVVNYIEVGLYIVKKEENDIEISVNVREINKEIVDIDKNGRFVFDKGNMYYEENTNVKDVCVFDDKFNVHVIGREELGHYIYYV